ncbi:DUF4350 domain-containing protein [Congregibacter litoralis]|uniref:DUF4350 domain-containing protein n=1 Tax=Congregibacter litoralis KT71 TaxID=314285 RepID=A4AAZ3_9GAMM|nr:DUF4350 domain-containing protein [Congregibacter litoralis]EAQ96865.2 hypothetical protein KT71_11209 [Congregibacter litoralis KT71]
MPCRHLFRVCSLGMFFLLAACAAQDTQVVDSTFSTQAEGPAYAYGQGPVVLIDESHHNFHTAEGRYKPFAELLRSDGYVVQSLSAGFTPQALSQGRILVIANALSEKNVNDWSLPNYPAFTPDEISAVRKWVAGGGALLLIADHMPMPAAAKALAAAFGVEFENGYAIRTGFESPRPPIVFSRENGTLRNHGISNGRRVTEKINAVATFTGHAFKAEGAFAPLLVFGPATEQLYPEEPAVFTERTPRVDIEGWYQGIALSFGGGRVAVFGEAAMFSAQTLGEERRPMGMNAPIAQENAQFALNTLHWLSGILD